MKTIHFAVTLGALAGLVACGGADGAPGAAGTSGTAGAKGVAGEPGKAGTSSFEPSISLVEPRAAVLGAQVEVSISIDGLDLAAKPTLTMGDGITVRDLAVSAKRTLIALVEVAPTAKLGFRDVTISSGDKKLVATGGFQVAAGLGAKISGGKAEQGGLVQLDLTNNDSEWFAKDTFTVFANAKATDGSLAQLSSDFVGPKDARVVLLADPGLKTGPLGVIATNYPDEANPPVYIGPSDTLTVAARTPEVLGTTEVNKVFSAPFTTHLFKYSTVANRLNVVTILANDDTVLTPAVYAMGTAGNLADKLSDEGYLTYPTTAAGASTIITYNSEPKKGGTDAATYGYSIQLEQLASTAPATEDTTIVHDGSTATAFDPWDSVPNVGNATPVRMMNGELVATDTADVYRLGTFSTSAAVDLEISAFSSVPLEISVSTDPTFPEASTTVATIGYFLFFGVIPIETGNKIGNAVDSSTGQYRYVRVRPYDTTKRGKYTLAVRRVATP